MAPVDYGLYTRKGSAAVLKIFDFLMALIYGGQRNFVGPGGKNS